MYKWENVTEFFSEEERYYKDCYLEIDEVYDEKIEVSLFSSQEGLYEIYFSYGRMYGIIYVGYRVNSKKATMFRIWANRVLKEFIIYVGISIQYMVGKKESGRRSKKYVTMMAI